MWKNTGGRGGLFGCKPGWWRRCIVRQRGGVRAPCPQHPSGLGVCLGLLQGTGVAAIATGGQGALSATPILPQVSGYRGAGGFAHGLRGAECPGRGEWRGGLAAL